MGGFLLSLQTGLVRDHFYTLGLNWSGVYLLDGKKPVLFESGFACAAGLYEEGIRTVLGRREPKYLFLTHSHWDHCGSTGHLKNVFPSLEVCASARAADILKRPKARELIAGLSEEIVAPLSAVPGVDPSRLLAHAFQPFEVDRVLTNGQRVELEEGLTVEVLATPGHTRDQLSYYIPERRILIATESAGLIERSGQIVSEFLVDYDAYVASIERLAALPVEVLCQGHHYVLVGRDEVERFFARSLEEAERFKNRVYELLDAESGSIERVMERIKAEQWDGKKGPKQPLPAYLLNLRARVSHLAKRKTQEP
ncbi:MAG: MBL fold metallo-hydrolase [Desulfobacteraceae bacterium]|nr:MAG: MBL fold metallo-hydrolase [Desulfobacteraceae bacterium]